MTRPSGNFTHGTRTAMRNYGCHCEACRAGNALSQREVRQRRLQGGRFTCPECSIAYGEAWKLARHRRDVHGEPAA